MQKLICKICGGQIVLSINLEKAECNNCNYKVSDLDRKVIIQKIFQDPKQNGII